MFIVLGLRLLQHLEHLRRIGLDAEAIIIAKSRVQAPSGFVLPVFDVNGDVRWIMWID